MSMITIGVAFGVGLLLALVISSLISRSRNTTDSFHPLDNGVYGVHHPGYLGHVGQTETTNQHQGDLGGRDMSHDQHSHTDSGGGGDWGGGDAGGGGDSGGGGGE